jgi:hypothetical protein
LSNKFRDIHKAEIPKDQETENKAAPEKVQKPKKARKKGVLAKGLSSIFSGTFLGEERNFQHLPFILFLAFMAILYIANGYYADDKIRKVNKITDQLKELRSEYISTKSELMFASKQSEVARSAEQLGLKEPVVPPHKIEVDSALLIRHTK